MPHETGVGWDRVIEASIRLQQLVPDSVLGGGSAAAR
jgi:hypothetical protein